MLMVTCDNCGYCTSVESYERARFRVCPNCGSGRLVAKVVPGRLKDARETNEAVQESVLPE
jgi:ssDNA-binding Zn-finger/Zn-ribbon topoisomerase 1